MGDVVEEFVRQRLDGGVDELVANLDCADALVPDATLRPHKLSPSQRPSLFVILSDAPNSIYRAPFPPGGFPPSAFWTEGCGK